MEYVKIEWSVLTDDIFFCFCCSNATHKPNVKKEQSQRLLEQTKIPNANTSQFFSRFCSRFSTSKVLYAVYFFFLLFSHFLLRFFFLFSWQPIQNHGAKEMYRTLFFIYKNVLIFDCVCNLIQIFNMAKESKCAFPFWNCISDAAFCFIWILAHFRSLFNSSLFDF